MVKKQNPNRIISLILVITIVLSVAYLTGIFKKSCSDDQCFNSALSSCTPAEFTNQRNNNLYVYSIISSFSQECSVEVEFARVAPGSDYKFRQALEGKSMNCKIPKPLLRTQSLDKINNLLQYCHGELKEGMLELLIEKTYTQIILNLNEVI